MSSEMTNLDPEATLQFPLTGVKLIEASAGTGKTYTITNLYLLHLFSGHNPSEILVVTFTNAATEELRCRIRDRVSETLRLFDDPVPVADQFLNLLLQRWQSLDKDQQNLQIRQLQLAIRSMDEAAIHTIHGFCQQTLTDQALSTGQSYDTALMNDDLSLWEDALKDWWRQQSYPLSRDDWQLFNSSLIDFKSLSSVLKEIRGTRQPRLLPVVEESLDELYVSWRTMEQELKNLARSWQQSANSILEILQGSKALSRSKKLDYHPDNLSMAFQIWDGYFNSNKLLIIPASLKSLGSSYLVQNSKPKQRHSEPELESGFFMELQLVLDQIENIQALFKVAAIVEANQYAQDRVLELKQHSHKIAFEDQLVFLRQALDGPSSQVLAQQLRIRYPIAMIDEFQDTDTIQFGIFKKLYFGCENVSLTMIGDPKQAIYSFRGGDIFTYIKARQEAKVKHYSLLTNWRSEESLVQAVNTIFSRRESPFVYADSIDYRAIEAADKPPRPLIVDGQAPTAISIWSIPLNADQKTPSKNETYGMLNRAIANEIARLLEGAGKGQVKLGEQPLSSSDIAILVRTGDEGKAIRQALMDRGIRAVTIGRDRVFESEEALGLYQLLQAVSHFGDRRLLRTALASSLLNFNYIQISQVIDDEKAWQDWCESIRNLHLAWVRKGFVSMFQHLMQELDIGRQLAESGQGERALTNLLHLGELCQQHSQVSTGFDSLLAWYRDQIEDHAAEDTELRLESDEDLVKIVTIHKSKGLEYPIVFAPFLWTCRPVKTGVDSVLKFHDELFNPVIDLSFPPNDQHVFLAEKERLAEDIRLAYVAITRARARVYLAWGNVGKGTNSGRPAKTGLGYLLHPGQEADALNHSLPWAFDDSDCLTKDLDSLVAESKETIEVKALPIVDSINIPHRTSVPTTDLKAGQFRVELANQWRINSFSSLTRDVHQTPHGGSRDKSNDAILDFPAGSHVGLLLHSLLEKLDFQQPIDAQCTELLDNLAARFDLDTEEYRAIISNWMNILVQSPLNNKGLTLSSLPNNQRMNELAFDFSLDQLDTGRLNPFLENLAGQPLAALEPQNFRGMITGVIDLIFQHEGRFYLADYKSNFLGASLEDYNSEKLRQAIYDRRYDLQYLLYSIALHRYLAQRVPNYCYEQHFGGVYYLFIRAMRPEHGSRFGVFYNMPDYNKLLELDNLMTGKR